MVLPTAHIIDVPDEGATCKVHYDGQSAPLTS